jgi:5'-3' exonuclease
LSHGGVSTGLTFAFLTTLREHLNKAVLSGSTPMPFILWDGKAQFRLDRYPAYKGTRIDTQEKRDTRAAYSEQKGDLLTALGQLGVTQLSNPYAEADDLAAPMISSLMKFSGVGLVTLLSADSDWLQLVQPGVIYHNHRTHTQVGVWNFKEHAKVANPELFVQHKALTGDKQSDNIDGVGGISEVYATALIEEYGSVPAFFAAYEALDAKERAKLKKVYRKLAENAPNKRGEPMREVYERNLWLVDIRNQDIPLRFPMSATCIVANVCDANAFYATCQMLGFNSIINDFDNWVAPFLAVRAT